MKKYLIWTFLAFILISCGGNGNKDAEISRLQAEIESLKSKQNVPSNNIESSSNELLPYGTWEFVDFEGKKWMFTFNEDGSAFFSNNGKDFYVEAQTNWKGPEIVHLRSDFDKSRIANIVFPSKKTADNIYFDLDIKNNILWEQQGLEIKAPDKKIAIKRIK